MPGFLAAAAPVLGAAVSGLFGSFNSSKANKFNKRMDNTKIQRTVRDAKAAGINPLTAIGAGTGSSHPTAAVSPTPAFGDAFAQSANALSNNKQIAAQMDLLKAQTKGQEIDNQLRLMQLKTASHYNKTVRPSLVVSPSVSASNNRPVRSELAGNGHNDVDAPRHTTNFGPVPVERRPGSSGKEAEQAEAAYGGLFGEAAGLTNLGADFYYTHREKALAYLYDLKTNAAYRAYQRYKMRSSRPRPKPGWAEDKFGRFHID